MKCEWPSPFAALPGLLAIVGLSLNIQESSSTDQRPPSLKPSLPQNATRNFVFTKQSHIKMGSTATLALDSIPLTKHIPSTPCPPSSSTWAGCAWDGEWRLGLPGNLHPTGGDPGDPQLPIQIRPFHHGQLETCPITQLDPSLRCPNWIHSCKLIHSIDSMELFLRIFGTSPFTQLPFFFAKKTRLVRSCCEKWAKSLCFAFWGDFVPFVLMRHLRSSEWWSFEPEGDVRMDRWSTSQ